MSSDFVIKARLVLLDEDVKKAIKKMNDEIAKGIKADEGKPSLGQRIKDYFSGIFDAIIPAGGGMAGAGGAGAGAGAAAGGGTLAVISVALASIVFIAKEVLNAVKKVVDMFRKASPFLDGMFRLLNTMFMLVLKPIGDFIAFLLKPILVFLLRNLILPFYHAAMPLIKQMGEKFAKMAEEYFPRIMPLVDKLIDVGIPTLLLLLTFIEWIFDQILKTAALVGDVVNFFDTLPEKLGVAFSAMGKTIGETFNNIGGKLKEAWDGFTKDVGKAWENLKSAWDNLHNFFNGLWDKFKEMYDSFMNWLKEAWKSLITALYDIRDRLFWWVPKFQQGGIAGEGLAYLHAGEMVLSKRQTDMFLEAMSRGNVPEQKIMNVNVNNAIYIYGGINGIDDLSKIGDAASKAIAEALRRRL